MIFNPSNAFQKGMARAKSRQFTFMHFAVEVYLNVTIMPQGSMSVRIGGLPGGALATG